MSSPRPDARSCTHPHHHHTLRAQRIESTLGVGKDYSKELALIAAAKASHPDNIAMKHFDLAYFDSLEPALQDRMIACARSGFENADSGMGAYAIQPDDYEVLHPYLDKCVRDYHKVRA
eukprot:SAG22_NODE_29_length_28404_cov_23.294153_21_plen_119_part_00